MRTKFLSLLCTIVASMTVYAYGVYTIDGMSVDVSDFNVINGSASLNNSTGKYEVSADANQIMSFSLPQLPDIFFSYSNTSENIVVPYKFSRSGSILKYIQVDRKNSVMTINGLQPGDKIVLSVGSKGATPNSFEGGLTGCTLLGGNITQPAKSGSIAYESLTLLATASTAEITCTDGGYCLRQISLVPDEYAPTVIANGTCGENLTWELNELGLLTISGTGAMDDYDNGYYSVPWSSYARSTITSVNIGNGVTSIGANAFNDCRVLSSVTIGNGVASIGNNAFAGCRSLTDIFIPSSVTSLGSSVFSGCTNLNIHIPDIAAWCNIEFNDFNGFDSNSNPLYYHLFLNDTEITDLIIPEGVTTIADGAFAGCIGVLSTTLPNSVINIGDRTFQNCTDLTSVSIGNGVTSIGHSAFNGCSNLTSINIPNSVTIIGNYAFGNCSGLTSINIGNGVDSIGFMAFSDCSNLNSIIVDANNATYDSRGNCNAIIETATNTLIVCCQNTIIPHSVTCIGSQAFRNFSSLTTISIPNGVTCIGGEAFYGCTGLTSITLPNSVTSIGDNAFYNCKGLTSIAIPNNVTSIGGYAFLGCTGLTAVHISDLAAWCNIVFEDEYANPLTHAYHLFLNGTEITDLIIPDGITKVNPYAFSHGSNFSSVTIPNSVTSIGSWAFYHCSGLTSVTIPNGVTSIDHRAFRYCSRLSSIIIPNSVTSIGGNAFADCTGLTAITLPDSITQIEYQTFRGCTGLTSVTIPNSVTTIGSAAFRDCTGLTSVTIPDSVTSIEGSAFRDCSGLTSLTIPNSVTSIGEYSFSGCSRLTSVTIPNSVTSIGNYAFGGVLNIIYSSEASGSPWGAKNVNGLLDGWLVYNDESKTTILGCSQAAEGLIEIPNSVTSIRSSAFVDCTGLTAVEITDIEAWCTIVFEGSWSNPLSYAHHLFLGGNELTNLIIPNSVTSIGSNAFYGCTSLTSITIPNSVTSIGASAFRDCTGLTSVTIPDSVTSIEGSAFRDCTGLTSVTIPNTVTSIGGFAFYGCSGLTTITIPNSVRSIGDRAFSGCSGLESIVVETGNTRYDSRENCNAIINTLTNSLVAGCKHTVIPSSVTRIQDAAFYGCIGLTSITIPNSVTSIGWTAFQDCKGLTSIIIPNSVTTIRSSAFNGCSGLETIVVEPENVNYDSRENCNALIETETNTLITGCQSTIIPNSVTSIGASAFRDCSGLTSVTIPNSITSIGSSAFYDCIGLTSITIPNSVSYIGSSAFSGCTNISSVFIEGVTPPSLEDETVWPTDFQAKLYVPCGSLSAYLDTYSTPSYSTPSYWYWTLCFNDIQEMCVTGDINEDGVVNVMDATMLIGAYLNNTTDQLNMSIADVNHDGVINVMDATEIINIYLNNR